jgi:dihydrofolate reductase
MASSRKLVVGTFLSLDGVMQAPGGPDEDRDGGFPHGGWTVPLFDDELGQFATEQTSRAGGLLLGRKTYEGFAATWPLVSDEDPIAATLNRIPKYVASRTLKRLEWNNSTLLGDDVPGAVAELKQEPGGELQVAGSGNLIQTLLRHDLVDEFNLMVFPVLLGSGKRLFGDGTIPVGLQLVHTIVTGNGVAVHTYQRTGTVQYGAVGPEYES